MMSRPRTLHPFPAILLLLLTLFSGSLQAQQPAFLTNGLVAYYPLNENIYDTSGNRFSGSLVSGGYSVNRFTEPNSALSLNGKSQYVTLPLLTSVSSSKQVTISAWVSSDFFESNINQTIFNHWISGVTTEPIGLILNIRSGKLAASFIGGTEYLTSESIISNSKWQQCVLVFNGEASIQTNKLFCFVNGVRHSFSSTPTNLLAVGNLATFTRIGGESGGYSGNWYTGLIDDIRIYNRALSDSEVKALYDYEKVPQPSNPRIATATPQVVNGFVVGATVTDGGIGYTNAPTVTITGGGGAGATARATVLNGSVSSIIIQNPGSGYTSTPTITIAPPPFPPRKATGTSTVVNGFVVSATITDAGFGYTAAPPILLVGGGGSGATAVATVANGVVTGINITNPGSGYTTAPTVKIASPPFSPSVDIQVSRVQVTLKVVLGTRYLLESSTDLNTWTATGPAFVAEDEQLVQQFDVDTVGRYFRISQVP
jgi:hypothetical protein